MHALLSYLTRFTYIITFNSHNNNFTNEETGVQRCWELAQGPTVGQCQRWDPNPCLLIPFPTLFAATLGWLPTSQMEKGWMAKTNEKSYGHVQSWCERIPRAWMQGGGNKPGIITAGKVSHKSRREALSPPWGGQVWLPRAKQRHGTTEEWIGISLMGQEFLMDKNCSYLLWLGKEGKYFWDKHVPKFGIEVETYVRKLKMFSIIQQ